MTLLSRHFKKAKKIIESLPRLFKYIDNRKFKKKSIVENKSLSGMASEFKKH